MARMFAIAFAALLVFVPNQGADYTLRTFQKIQVTDQFWSEGAAYGDFNHDGHQDIVSGPYWYEGPDFKKRHEFRPADKVFFTQSEVDVNGHHDKISYSDSFVAYVFDFNGDGWPDILNIDIPGKGATWYENPGSDGLKAGTPWKVHPVFDVVTDESPELGDLFKNGKPVIVCMTGNSIGYVQADWNHPDQKWTFHAAAEVQTLRNFSEWMWKGKPYPYTHGIGYGDINGDGRNDILSPEGWYEQPASLKGDPQWKFHPWPFLSKRPDQATLARLAKSIGKDQKAEEQLMQYYVWPYMLDGAQMYVYDVNGDGLPDLITSFAAHGYGLAWFEQLKERDASGGPQFKKHTIMGKEPSENPYGVKFSQLHAVDLADIDGDGLKDIVTGKRPWAHGHYTDEEPGAPKVIYWFQLVRKPGGKAEYIPHLIDDDSGVGTQVMAGDINGDGLPDIVVGNKKGTYVFLQQAKKVSKAEWEAAQPKIKFPDAEN